MKFMKDVSIEMIESVLNGILSDMQEYIDDAQKEYDKDKTDDFHGNMALMFGLAKDLVEGRLSVLADEIGERNGPQMDERLEEFMKERLGVSADDVKNMTDEEFYALRDRAEGLEIFLADRDDESQEATDAAHIVDWLNDEFCD